MSNISSLGALKKKNEEEDEAKRNELYIGGLDQRGGGSGLSVLGPPPSGRAPNVFDNIVQRASNPEANGPVDMESSGDGNRRLITMYRNGFTVDEGPFRDINAPENRVFLASLERGEVPSELLTPAHMEALASGNRGQLPAIEVALSDKRGEDYVAPPPPAYVAFSGTAARLGDSTPTDTSIFSAELLRGVEVPIIDETKPTTLIQVRTSDGKKLKIKINLDSTVLQLAAMVFNQNGSQSSFSLSAGFPPKELSDFNQTILDAGLKGAAVTHKAI